MGYLYETALAEDESTLSQVADFVTKGLPAMAVSGGLGVANTAIALGNMVGADAEQYDTIKTTEDLLGSDIANYYREHETMVDVGGIIVSSIIPGTAAVRAARAGQTMLANAAAREGAGLLTTTTSKLLGKGNEVSSLVTAIRSGNATTQGMKVSVAGNSLRQNLIESAVFETAAIMSNNQNSVLNSKDLDYINAITSNLDTVAFGAVLGGGFGAVVGGFGNWGKLKTAQREHDIDMKAIMARDDISIKGVAAGDNLVNNVANYQRSMEAIPEGGYNGLAEGAGATNAVLKTADHNARVSIKAQLMELSGLDKAPSYVKSDSVVHESTLNAVIDDLHELLTNKATSIDGIAQTFGNLQSISHLPTAKPAADGLLDKVKTGIAARLDAVRVSKSRTAMKEGETELESIYYSIRNSGIKRASRDKKTGKIYTVADKQDAPATSLRSMISTIDAHIAKAGMEASEDAVMAVLPYKDFTGIAKLMETTNVGKALHAEIMETLSKQLPELALATNHAGITKLSSQELGELMTKYGNVNSPSEMFKLALKVAKVGELSGAKSPLLSRLLESPVIVSRFQQNAVYFNRTTNTFTATPVGATAADYGKLSLVGDTLHYAGGRELSSKTAFDFKGIVEGNVDLIDATAKWAHSKLTATSKGWNTYSKVEKPIEAGDFFTLETTLESFRKMQIESTLDIEFKAFMRMGTSGKSIVKELDYNAAAVHLTKLKQSALLELAAKNETTKQWSIKDLQNILNVSEDFVVSGGAKYAGAFSNSVDYLKANNLRFTYGSSDLSEGYAKANALVEVRRRQAEARTVMDNATTSYLNGRGANTISIPNAVKRGGYDPTMEVTRSSGTQTFVSSQQGENLGEAMFQGIGSMFSRFRQSAIETANTALGTVGRRIQGNQAALAELAVVNAKLASGDYGVMLGKELKEITELVKLVPEGQAIADSVSYIIPAETIKIARMGSFTAAELQASMVWRDKLLSISAIKHDDVATFITNYGKLNGSYVNDRNTLNRLTGDSYDWNPHSIPAITPKLSDTPELATVTIGGDKGIIAARNVRELQAKIAVITKNAPNAKVSTISQIEKDALELNGFDWDNAITSNSTNADLRKLGVQWDVLPEASTGLVDRFIDSTVTRRVKLDRSYIREHYIEDFRKLELEADAFGRVSKQAKNFSLGSELSPQERLINSALGLQNKEEYKLYRNLQEKVGELINAGANRIIGATAKLESALRSKKTSELDNAWKEVADAQRNHGLPAIYAGAEDYIISTSNVGRDRASEVVSKMNAFTSYLMLRTDQIQGMVNAMSTPVTLLPAIKELKTFLNKEMLEGVLEKHAGVKIPFSTDSFLSDSKLMMESFAEFGNKKLVEKYSAQGLISRDLATQLEAIESFGAVAATMNAAKIDGFLGKVGGLLTKLNDKSESLVRFAAVRSADKIIDDAVALASPHMARKLEDMRYSILNNVVTKVHGNYVASQRPTIFQGWGGQAIGLFQTYQFNLIQMLTRNIEQGDLKNAMRMVATQGTIFGGQSLPGFQAINNHIGEKTNARTDIYSETSKNFNKGFGDFLLYGAASSITAPFGTGINFYTRGDLTPRTPILIPTSVGEVPIVNFLTKFGKAATAAYQQAGVDMNEKVLWQLLAHQGFSRPLSGVGQLLLGGKTTATGTTLLDFDDLDFKAMNSVVKLMGTSTTEESIKLGAFYRAKAYQSNRQAQLDRLGMGVRVASQQGGRVNVREVMQSYMESGGDGANFDRWYQKQLLNVNESQYNLMKSELQSPEGRYLQSILD